MNAAAELTYTVEAYNLSHASENKIHDDTVAQKLGFAGGLVPGVEVFAYASHVPVMHWGRVFLERGRMACRFAKPVYDGATALVTGQPVGDRLELRVESNGVLCATGTASLPPPSGTIDAHSYAAAPPAQERPPADETSLAVGTVLGIAPKPLTTGVAETYLADARETAPIYAAEGLAHPGYLLRLCNLALVENVVLAPWIHTGSVLQFLSTARIGETLSVRARVTANTERKGHRFVDLDCLILADDRRPVAQVAHTAIYRLRHLAA